MDAAFVYDIGKGANIAPKGIDIDMWIKKCPQCGGRSLQAQSEFMLLRPLPRWLEPRNFVLLIIGAGVIASIVSLLAKKDIISGATSVIAYLPLMAILFAMVAGWMWWKMRLRYGKVVYHVACRQCQYHWDIEEKTL